MQTISEDIKSQGETLINVGSVSGDINLRDCVVLDGIQGQSSDICVRNSEVIGSIATNSGDIRIWNSSVGGSLRTISGDIEIVDSRVGQDVSTISGSIHLDKVRIQGTLFLQISNFQIKRSYVNKIVVVPCSSTSFVQNISTFESFSRTNSGGGVSVINGVTIKTFSTETHVTTPEGYIYVNQKRIYGDGPDTFEEYKQKTGISLNITGPGWGNLGKLGLSQSIEIFSDSSVGWIVFESGNGKVILHPGAELFGEVTGGVIEKL